MPAGFSASLQKNMEHLPYVEVGHVGPLPLGADYRLRRGSPHRMSRRGSTPSLPATYRHEASDPSKLHPPSKSRMQFPQSPRARRHKNGRISTVRVHNLKYLEGNCMRNWSPTDERWPQGLPTRIRTLTVNAFSGSSAALPRKTSPSTAHSATAPRKTSPSTGLPVALPRKNSPSAPENSIFRPFWACRANYFAHTPIPGRVGRTISRITRDDGATLKPPTPLHATLHAPLKPTTPLQGVKSCGVV